MRHALEFGKMKFCQIGKMLDCPSACVRFVLMESQKKFVGASGTMPLVTGVQSHVIYTVCWQSEVASCMVLCASSIK